jgi:hypothetical protein
MISVSIGAIEFPLDGVSEDWLHSQIHGRRKDGVPVVVRVTIKTPDLDMVLCTPSPDASAPGRRPYPSEVPVLNLWCMFKLDRADFRSIDLISFLRRIAQHCQ